MMDHHSNVMISDIWKAKKRIEQVVLKTPLIKSHGLSEALGRPVYLKLENYHEIGAFKVRGAANKILSLTADELKKGVTTFSTGNHGLAVAYVAQQLGVRAVICISERVPKAKIDAIKRFGAELEIKGHGQDDAYKSCLRLHEEEGLTIIPPFDDPYIIAGQGTIGLEILEQLPNVETAVIPLSGGGLLAGVALALKSNNPQIQIKGVSMEKAAVMYESLKVGKPIELKEEDTLADSLLGGIGLENRYTFKMVQQLMNDTILVSEKAIADGMKFMLNEHRMIVEGAAATGAAAVLHKKVDANGGDVVLIVSGSNVDLSLLFSLL
jgi:threonine dehydratase